MALVTDFLPCGRQFKDQAPSIFGLCSLQGPVNMYVKIVEGKRYCSMLALSLKSPTGNGTFRNSKDWNAVATSSNLLRSGNIVGEQSQDHLSDDHRA